jgi:hypothetical protein
MNVAPDIESQLKHDFPQDFTARLKQLTDLHPVSDRLIRCIVFAARGHPWYFDFLCRRAKHDYRDVLKAAEYEPGGAH